MAGIILPNQPQQDISPQDFYREAFGQGYKQGYEEGAAQGAAFAAEIVMETLKKHKAINHEEWTIFLATIDPDTHPGDSDDVDMDTDEYAMDRSFFWIDAEYTVLIETITELLTT